MPPFFGGTRFTCQLLLSWSWGCLVWSSADPGRSLRSVSTVIGRIINGAGDFGPIFGTGERLLLPFGLQHILVALIRFTEAGGYHGSVRS